MCLRSQYRSGAGQCRGPQQGVLESTNGFGDQSFKSARVKGYLIDFPADETFISMGEPGGENLVIDPILALPIDKGIDLAR